MSQGARWVIGIFSGLFALMMFYSERTAPSNAPVVGYLVGAFCVAITMACFSKVLRSPALRVIGATVFVATVAYLVDELLTEPGKTYSGTSEPHWLNAIFALITFGLPGLFVTLHGVYPRWGKGSQVLRGKATDPDEDPFANELTNSRIGAKRRGRGNRNPVHAGETPRRVQPVSEDVATEGARVLGTPG